MEIHSTDCSIKHLWMDKCTGYAFESHAFLLCTDSYLFTEAHYNTFYFCLLYQIATLL